MVRVYADVSDEFNLRVNQYARRNHLGKDKKECVRRLLELGLSEAEDLEVRPDVIPFTEPIDG